jgi:hypothetical protein
MQKIIIKIIKFYQMLPIHTHSACRFYPTCSNYAIEAISIHGSIKGTYLIIKRILRCNPFNKKSGIDLVPPKNK